MIVLVVNFAVFPDLAKILPECGIRSIVIKIQPISNSSKIYGGLNNLMVVEKSVFGVYRLGEFNTVHDAVYDEVRDFRYHLEQRFGPFALDVISLLRMDDWEEFVTL